MLFVDEIHRLSPVVEEILSGEGRLSARHHDREGPGARSSKDLPPFTLVVPRTAGVCRAIARPIRHCPALEFYNEKNAKHRDPIRRKFSASPRAGRRAAYRAALTRNPAHRQSIASRVRDFAEVRRMAVLLMKWHRPPSIAGWSIRWLRCHGSKLLLTSSKVDGDLWVVESLAAALGEERGTMKMSESHS